MFKQYKFKVKVKTKDGKVLQEDVLSFKDRSEKVAKDMLRLSLQLTWQKQLDSGEFPRVELECLNSDIGHYEEDK